MKKLSFYLNAAAALMFAFTTTAGLFSCAENGDNPVDPEEPVLPVDPNTIHDGDDLVQIVADATAQAIINGDDEVLVVLPAGVKLIQTGTIASTMPLTIVSDPDDPAQIALAGGYSPANNLLLRNLIYDAAGVAVPFIALNTNVVAPQNKYGGSQGFYFIDDITIDNVAIYDIKGSIIYDNNVKYCLENLTINNSILRLATEDVAALKYQSWIAFQAGGIMNSTYSNSTFYQVATTYNETGANGDSNTYFVRYNNNGGMDRFIDKNAYPDLTATISYQNNTFWNVCTYGKWTNYTRINNYKAAYHIDVQNNIFVQCGNGEAGNYIINRQGANGFGSVNYNNNTYWWGETDGEEAAKANGNDNGYQLTTNPDFVAPGVDFTPQGAEQLLYGTGDPRWLN